MTRARLYTDKFTSQRRLAWLRIKNQAIFRDEAWDLSFEDFCSLWSDPHIWASRGRAASDLVMTRLDLEKAWTKTNVCILIRHKLMLINGARLTGGDVEPHYKDAITL